ncbi:MAG: serine/threonine protein kinase [Armatimonadetes bacterium]|nr:serine/threonine protein kinase [Armatimonadota bacterium]
MQIRRRRHDRTVLAPGQVLQAQDCYEVGDVIGEGGYAVVYGATSGRQREVALKEFVPGGTVAERDQVRSLFLRERDMLWQLRSQPHLPDLIEAFAQDGMRYLVLELVPGESLAERLAREGGLTMEEVGSLSLQVTRAVAALHSHGVVHHDVKPANVKLAASGLAVLLDLGSARLVGTEEEGDHPLREGLHGYLFGSQAVTQIAGTPGYMAPELREMVQSDSLRSDLRLDVFALGSTIYELVTGERLDQGEIDLRHETLTAQAHSAVGNFFPALSGPVARALALETSARYPSARELLAELEDVIPPRPLVRHSRLEFAIGTDATEHEQTLLVTNAGGGRLFGEVRSEHPALNFRRSDGSLTRVIPFAGNVNLIRVVANGGRRREELDEGEIVVTTECGELRVVCEIRRESPPIRLTVAPTQALLRVTPQMLQQVTVVVRNVGVVRVSVVSEASDTGLVEVTPGQATLAPGASAEFRVRPTVRSNHPGKYAAEVNFRANGGSAGSPVRITLDVRRDSWRGFGRRSRPPRR